jgi:hypothetical protein
MMNVTSAGHTSPLGWTIFFNKADTMTLGATSSAPLITAVIVAPFCVKSKVGKRYDYHD